MLRRSGTIAAQLAFTVLELFRPAGLDFIHRNSPTPEKYVIETMGGGVAVVDYNNDGLLDVFLVNSGKALRCLNGGIRCTGIACTGRIATVSFTDVTAAAGLSNAANALWHGRGHGRFRQRRVRRHLRHQLRPQPALPQQRRRHVQRCDGAGRRRGRRLVGVGGFPRLRPRRRLDFSSAAISTTT